MQARCLATLLLISVASCGPAAPGGGDAGSQTTASNLTAAQKNKIGRKIWQNECGGTVDGLTTWNAGEEFPSMGIGHFIWYPAGFNGRFEESFPQFIAYARQQGSQPPAVALQRHSPWTSKAQFQGAFRSQEMNRLRSWLSKTVPLQTDFIIARSRGALSKILAAAPASDRARIKTNYEKVASTSNGTYALIDYVNFKGDGTKASGALQGPGLGTAAGALRHEGRPRRPTRGQGILGQRQARPRPANRQLPARPWRVPLARRMAQPLQYLRKATLMHGRVTSGDSAPPRQSKAPGKTRTCPCRSSGSARWPGPDQSSASSGKAAPGLQAAPTRWC